MFGRVYEAWITDDEWALKAISVLCAQVTMIPEGSSLIAGLDEVVIAPSDDKISKKTRSGSGCGYPEAIGHWVTNAAPSSLKQKMSTTTWPD